MGNFSKDVTSASFEKDVLLASSEVPVIVDFWASWCAPCKVLKPILEKLADEYRGKFKLAKVDTEKDPELAARFGVRGIPNVKAFVGGALVAEFSGAIPEPSVRAFIDKIIPSPSERLRLQANAAMREGDFETAESRLYEAVKLDPGHREARLDLVGALIARHAYSEADLVLAQLAERERSERGDAYARQIMLWKKGQSLPASTDLAAQVESRPGDLDLRLQLGERLVAESDYEGALCHLIEVVRGDRGALREQARRTVLEVFNLATDGGQTEMVGRYRRLLASAIY
ncbi:MAG: hypothetical protein A3G25_06130 [Betaproteobacteria bacterium RIFCSPLOWO2_12_FULL_63_13]|nr:MAG: hypothetical protein A3H32_03225 [Betaproteobacteria bacterium RIFCSPLOWO2_02_FULL_63_19]OGA53369.1 MAG: hypothetical protein A3G25_06130 [Betaproteobacteria bacterium RIFCSPLOWO2_12_FULL_63_13]